MPNKTCFKCLQTRSLTEFYVHGGMADGHLNKCEMPGHVAVARVVGTHLLDRIYRVESVRMVPAEAPDFDSTGGR